MSRKPKPTPERAPAYLSVVKAQAEDPRPNEGATAAKAGEVAAEAFAAPHWFGDEERAIFVFLQKHLRRLQILDDVDQVELQILARAIADWQRVQEEINGLREKNNGSLTYKTHGRNGVQHKLYPQVHQASQYEKIIAAYGSNFGLSAVDRERLKYLGRDPEGEQGSLPYD